MRGLKTFLPLLWAGSFCTALCGQVPALPYQPDLPYHLTGVIIVKPKPFDGVLVNPDIGFITFQRFNGDSLNPGGKWTEGSPIKYQPLQGTLETKDYPMSSIAYLRIYWRYIEPQQGVYHWDILDKALRTAHERQQTLMLRIAPYGLQPENDVPAWYRKLTGEPYGKALLPWHENWMVDPMNPAYVKFFGGMVRALGERYDGNPDLNVVDVSIVGPWGEGSGTSVLTQTAREGLMDSYLDSFHKTPLVIQPQDPTTSKYALSKANVGWRADCFGDLTGMTTGWGNMTDFYPEAIIDNGLADAWKKAPVTVESCWVMQTWEKNGWDLHYIVDQAIKWHVSSFNAKSSAVPKDMWPEVNRWLKHMGYRFALRRFTYPPVVDTSRKLAFTSWWENDGDAPCYRRFPLALRLSNAKTSVVMVTDADIRTWMPGDSLYNSAVLIPTDLADGNYELSIAIVDPSTNLPKVKLAIEGLRPDGWYRLGDLKVQQSFSAKP